MSQKERAELDLIREGMKLEVPGEGGKGKITFTCPVVKDPYQLKDNSNVAVKMVTKLEARLTTNGQLDEYNKQVRDFLDRGVIEEISLEELTAWEREGQPQLHQPPWCRTGLFCYYKVAHCLQQQSEEQWDILRDPAEGPKLIDSPHRSPDNLPLLQTCGIVGPEQSI